jgi:hypothetical protein
LCAIARFSVEEPAFSHHAPQKQQFIGQNEERQPANVAGFQAESSAAVAASQPPLCPQPGFIPARPGSPPARLQPEVRCGYRLSCY